MDAWAKACKKNDSAYAEWWQQTYGEMAEGPEKSVLKMPTLNAFRAGFAAGEKWGREDDFRWHT